MLPMGGASAKKKENPAMKLTPMLLLLALLSLAACSSADSSSSSNPSAQATYDKLASTYCQALTVCCSNGQLACASDFTEAKCESAFAQSISGAEACSDAQVNACLSDVRNQSCAALNPSTVTFPSSCNGC